jgi:DNA polymerase III epsilon subunit-like protein
MSTLEMRQECQRLLNLRPLFMECKASRRDSDGEVVELSLLDSDGSILVEEFARPKHEIEPAMSELHGITNDIARIAAPWAEVWPPVNKLLIGRLVGVFDLQTQLDWMRQSHINNYLRWDVNPANFFSIQKLHAEYQNEWDRAANSFRTFQLEEAATLVGLPSEPQTSHRRASEDARLARMILLIMAGWRVQ